MADQATGMAKELNAITECSICIEVYEDPRILPCIHTFCLKCIEKTADGRNPGEKIPCPVCREEFAVPKEGCSGLRENFFMSKLIDIKTISNPSAKDKVCDACKEDNEDIECEVSLAEGFCVECHQSLCQECCKHHKKNKLTKTHKVMAFGSPIDVSELTRSFPVGLCDHHATKPLEMFCEDCKNLICMLCYAESHHHHKCSGLNRLVPEFRKQMKEDADKVSSLRVERLKEAEVMQKAKSDLLVEFSTAENAIVKREEQLKELLRQQTKSLLDELALLKTKKLKEVDTEIDEIDRNMTIMDSYETYSLNVAERGSAFDICHGVHELHSRSAQLQDVHKSRVLRNVNSQKDLLQPTMLDNFLIQNNNIVGKLLDLPVFQTQQTKEDQAISYKADTFSEGDYVFRECVEDTVGGSQCEGRLLNMVCEEDRVCIREECVEDTVGGSQSEGRLHNMVCEEDRVCIREECIEDTVGGSQSEGRLHNMVCEEDRVIIREDLSVFQTQQTIEDQAISYKVDTFSEDDYAFRGCLEDTVRVAECEEYPTKFVLSKEDRSCLEEMVCLPEYEDKTVVRTKREKKQKKPKIISSQAEKWYEVASIPPEVSRRHVNQFEVEDSDSD